jgi:outer membrane protein TolC
MGTQTEKSAIFLLLPLLLGGENFSQIAHQITNSLKYRLQEKRIQLYQNRLKEVEGKKWGKLELQYQVIHLFQKPVLKFETLEPVGVVNGQILYTPVQTQMAMGKQDQFTGLLKYSYPLFTGFALSKSIEKAQLEVIREKLKLENLKRELLLKSGELYASIYQTRAEIWALEKAKEALASAQSRAKSLYREGLIDRATLEGITAKYYQVVASIGAKKAQKKRLLNLLSYLLNRKISKIDGVEVEKPTFRPNFQNRPDVKVLKEELKIADTQIALAKSRYYPQIGVEIGVKREGENLGLSRNSYRNIDQSYLAVVLNYPLFDGGEKRAQLEEAKVGKIAQLLLYRDYLKKVETDYQNDKAQLQALFTQLKAVKAEIKARESYYHTIEGKFREGLVDSSDLTGAIAQLAEARAQREALRAQIFFLTLKLRLDGGEEWKPEKGDGLEKEFQKWKLPGK